MTPAKLAEIVRDAFKEILKQGHVSDEVAYCPACDSGRVLAALDELERLAADVESRHQGEPCECGRPTSVCKFTCDFCTGGVS